MSAPIIGITTRTAPVSEGGLNSVMVQQSYTNAILNAGGVPVLIPSDVPESGWKVLFERLDGILFSGGGDIATEYFNGEPHPAVYGIEANRDEIELGLARFSAENQKPFLGICRGLQVVNVALGGTLYTHIPDQLPKALVHEFPGADGVPARTALAHPVRIEEGSRISQIFAEPILNVNSLHHQGVKDVAPGLKAVAYAPDGLVEALELPDHPFGIAVQWHPEWLTDQAAVRRLFKAFVDAASGAE
ncbi:MAG: gamma-glutamyl-gamma-aminobutyrate hydrolase family protein [Chloroflexi bacterium]|nr:gamma-glutamyl-gamma-aminobutyrate hydrolase family protein [Chloroflexota bacterium]